jgi:cold shock CspA family protein
MIISRCLAEEPKIISNAMVGRIIKLTRKSNKSGLGFIASENMEDEYFFHGTNLHFKTDFNNLSINDSVEFFLAESPTSIKKPMAVKIKKINQKPAYFFYIAFNPISYEIQNLTNYNKINPFEILFFFGKIEYEKRHLNATGIFEPIYYKELRNHNIDDRLSFDSAKHLFEKRLEGRLNMQVKKESILCMQRISQMQYENTIKKYKGFY